MGKYCNGYMKLRVEEGLNFGPTHGFSTMVVLQLTGQLLAQKLMTEMEHTPCFPDLAPNDFWLFPKIKFVLMGQRFQDIEDIQRN
jgi:hypothetical protein